MKEAASEPGVDWGPGAWAVTAELTLEAGCDDAAEVGTRGRTVPGATPPSVRRARDRPAGRLASGGNLTGHIGASMFRS